MSASSFTRTVVNPPDVDLVSPGRRDYQVRFEHPSIWGNYLVPLTVVVGPDAEPGQGMVAIGSTHGNEYEGPVAIKRILHDLDASTVTGRLVLIPVLNISAFKAVSRETAEDGGNLNRAFPGDPAGNLTSRFAAFVTEQVFPHVHLVFDLHAGGECARFALNNSFRRWDDPAQQRRMERLARGFGLPFTLTFSQVQPTGYLTGMAESLGKLTFGAELGHGAAVNHAGVTAAMQGLRHAMSIEGIVNAPPPVPVHVPDEQILAVCQATVLELVVMAPRAGHFEPLVELGVKVEAGQPLGHLHDFDRIDAPPLLLTAPYAGYVVSQAWGAEVQQGQILTLVGKPVPWSDSDSAP